ncbi:hypothetical protein [Aquabacter cavernae]|uniref:hypothetical protein n=1 Tax=Aquabacter cavernae TaxID=2496029 RepID=UPI000F8C9B68|nr:hypothetical protein [Aquabacter cavernae]
MLIEFKTRAAGASRVFINPSQIISVYVRADGCHIVTTERNDSGRNVQVLIDEPPNRVLAKLGIETPGAPHPAAPPLRQARDGEGATMRGVSSHAGEGHDPFAHGTPLPGEAPGFRPGTRLD